MTGRPVHRHAARAEQLRGARACSSGSTCPARRSTSGSRARVDRMWAAGWSTRCAAGRRRACARVAPRRGRSATRRCCASSTGECDRGRGRATRPSGPPGGSPAGRSRGSAATRGWSGWTRGAGPSRAGSRRRPRSAGGPAERARSAGAMRHAVRQGARHRERLRAAARPRRRARPARRRGRARSATAGPASAPTACCAWCAPAAHPEARRWPATPSGSWTTATPTARSPRCAATASGSSPATWSTRGWPSRRARRSPPAAGSSRCGSATSGDVTVDMGPAAAAGTDRTVARRRPHAGRRTRSTWATRTPSCSSTDLADAGDLRERAGGRAGRSPDGVNVEFVDDRGAGHVAMRVHERGVGETRSCGTGACAVRSPRRSRRRG